MGKLTRGDVIAWEIEHFYDQEKLDEAVKDIPFEDIPDEELLDPEEVVRRAEEKEAQLPPEEQAKLGAMRKQFNEEFDKYSEARTEFLLEDNPTWDS